MLERATRAAVKAMVENCSGWSDDEGDETAHLDGFVDGDVVVLAVLQAIREPTPGMIEAGRALQSIGDEELSPDDMRKKYQAMMSVLLAEAEKLVVAK